MKLVLDSYCVSLTWYRREQGTWQLKKNFAWQRLQQSGQVEYSLVI